MTLVSGVIVPVRKEHCEIKNAEVFPEVKTFLTQIEWNWNIGFFVTDSFQLEEKRLKKCKSCRYLNICFKTQNASKVFLPLKQKWLSE